MEERVYLCRDMFSATCGNPKNNRKHVNLEFYEAFLIRNLIRVELVASEKETHS